jgi:Homing endonuclease associated repeat/HNH endonuclease
VSAVFRFENTKPAPTNADLIADLQRIAAKLGTSHVPQNTYRNIGAYSSAVMKARFGSWNKAIAAAGLLTQHRPKLTTEELFENFIAVWTTLGRQPRKREMIKPLSKFTADPYVTRFGGWLSAMKAFVESINADPNLAPEEPRRDHVALRGPRDQSLRLRFRVMLRDNFRCCSCGRSPATHVGLVLHVDHIEPWVKNGPTTYENLQTLCSDCNLGKSDMRIK